jgi:hypothetical protein
MLAEPLAFEFGSETLPVKPATAGIGALVAAAVTGTVAVCDPGVDVGVGVGVGVAVADGDGDACAGSGDDPPPPPQAASTLHRDNAAANATNDVRIKT